MAIQDKWHPAVRDDFWEANPHGDIHTFERKELEIVLFHNYQNPSVPWAWQIRSLHEELEDLEGEVDEPRDNIPRARGYALLDLFEALEPIARTSTKLALTDQLADLVDLLHPLKTKS